MMDFRQLRQVMEICRLGSFVRAANVLGVSQPALSRSIARLEQQLGVHLFHRDSHGARPTAFAEHIFKRAEPTLSDVSTLVQEVEALAQGHTGSISISVGAAARETIAVPLLVKLLREFPGLRIDLTTGKAPQLIERLIRRELDIVITARELVPPMRDLTKTELFEDEVSFFSRPGHPLLKRKIVPSLEMILDYPLALPGRSRLLVGKAARSNPRRLKNLSAYVTHDYRLIRQIVERSDTIGQGPISVYADAFAAGTIVRIPARRSQRYHCVALTHRVSEHSHVVSRALELAREAARELPRPADAPPRKTAVRSSKRTA
ncbi:MAG: LysR family transcriptional regulator [Proteobacteria bacterium]|nr:LysR family transcriptional regulator [Pseudomonadota bacterium]